MKKTTTQLEKGAAVFLGVVCLFLFLNLIVRSRVRAAATRPTLSQAQAPSAFRTERAPAGRRDELARYDPELNLQDLKELDARPIPTVERNPFQFPPATPVHETAAGAGSPAAPAIPPPPPLPIHAVGFTERADGKPQAIVKDDQDIYVVHIGDTFGKHFRVLSISPRMVEVQDASTGQTAQLPIPE